MLQPIASLYSVAGARVRHASQRLGVRLALFAAVGLAGLIFLGFALAAATVALTERVGLLQALVIMAGGALVVVLVVVGVMAMEARRERRLAARRAALDRQLLRSAAIASAVPRATGLTTRGGIGMGLVALGALLVLAHRRRPDGED